MRGRSSSVFAPVLLCLVLTCCTFLLVDAAAPRRMPPSTQNNVKLLQALEDYRQFRGLISVMRNLLQTQPDPVALQAALQSAARGKLMDASTPAVAHAPKPLVHLHRTVQRLEELFANVDSAVKHLDRSNSASVRELLSLTQMFRMALAEFDE